MELLFIRHTSVDVPPGICYGQSDVPLNATFEEEAALTREAMAAYGPFEKSWSSPLSRCTRLAAFCGFPDAQLDPRLLETDFGAWEMQPYDSLNDACARRWFADYINTPAPGGESFRDQAERVASFLEDLRAEGRRGLRRALLFTHGGVIAAANVVLTGISPEEAFRNRIPYGGLQLLTL